MNRFKPNAKFEPVSGSESHNMDDWSSQTPNKSTYYSNASAAEQHQQFLYRRGSNRQKSTLKKYICFYISLLVGLGWLGPILYLLIVNIRGDIIGAAAWCPLWNEGCHAISYDQDSNVTSASLSQSFDEPNHDLLGALQFVAKALEVWFMYIATTLVWYVTSILARRPGGLPIGYLLTHLEFGDIRALFDPVLYTSAGSNGRGPSGGRRHTYHLYIFAATAIAMCIVTNLMGPSVAVLVIPTLHWQNNPQIPTGQFQPLLSGDAPSGDNTIPGCSASDFTAGNLNCTNIYYGNSLDSLTRSLAAEINQNDATPYNGNWESVYVASNTPVTLEQTMSFSFNSSATKTDDKTTTFTSWSYSRQLMRELSSDFEDLYTVVLGNTTNQTKIDHYAPYNNSLLLTLQRQGPVYGMQFFPSYGNRTITTVSDDKAIRCIEGFSLNYTTKCFRTGTGWNTSNNFDSFSIDVEQNVNLETFVAGYWVDKATYVQDGDPCFPNGTLPQGNNCNYDELFSNVTPMDDGDRMQDMFVLEYSLPTSQFPNSTFIVEVFPGYGFATYSIDVTNIWPSLQPVQVANPPNASNLYPMVIHPDWLLAAYSTVSGGDANPYGDTTFLLQDSMVNVLGNLSTPNFNAHDGDDYSRLFGVTYYSMLQAASFIPHTTTPTDSLESTAGDQQMQPVLWMSVYNQIWGFGIEGRTSKLGIIVAILGCVTTLVRTILLFVTREEERSSLEIIKTALEHQPQGTFGLTRSESDIARTRFQLLEDEDEEKMRLVALQ